MTAEQLPPSQSQDIIPFTGLTSLIPVRQAIDRFVKQDETTILGLTILGEKNRHMQLRIVATTLSDMLEALSDKRISPTKFQRQFHALKACDPITDDFGTRNFWLVRAAISHWGNSEDPKLNEKALQLSEAVGVQAMEDLDYPDITFCTPRKIAAYLSNALFEFTRIENHQVPHWRSTDFAARLNFITSAIIERDGELDPEDFQEQEESEFALEVRDALFANASREKIASITKTLQKYGDDTSEELLLRWKYADDEEDETTEGISLEDFE